jgi:predicted N-acetyltransferase YhbS
VSLVLRPATAADTERCGAICYEAFRTIATKHGFPPDFPDPQVATAVIAMVIGHPGFYGVVAEREGRIVGSNFVDERSAIAGIGPITVDPAAQDVAVGRALMADVLEREAARGVPGVRLVQAAYHARSLSLYAKLGFDVREPLATMSGPPLGVRVQGYPVREATEADVDACNALCSCVHGYDRGGELRDAVRLGSATVVELDGRIGGYATSIAFFGHAVAVSNEALCALFGAAPAFGGPGFLLPTRNAELFRWCLAHGLRVVHTMTLMSRGLYHEPASAFLPSIAY